MYFSLKSEGRGITRGSCKREEVEHRKRGETFTHLEIDVCSLSQIQGSHPNHPFVSTCATPSLTPFSLPMLNRDVNQANHPFSSSPSPTSISAGSIDPASICSLT